MLSVNHQQIVALEQVVEQSMVDSTIAVLYKNHSGTMVRTLDNKCSVKDLNHDLLNNLIVDSIRIARRCGFQSQADCSAFTVLRFISAPNFYIQPCVRAVFGNDLINVEQRIENLWRYTDEADWDAIVAAYDERDWQVGQ